MKKDDKKTAELNKKVDDALNLEDLDMVKGGTLRDAPKTDTEDITEEIQERI